MSSAKYIFLTILAFAISVIAIILESASYVYYEAQDVYRVYLNGDSIGLIEEKQELEDYVNQRQQALKNKYNVENVYIPQGLKIRQETTYSEKTEPVESIYSKIEAQEDFTINGYTITIIEQKKTKNEKDKEETEKIKEYIYVTDDSIIQGAVEQVVKSFVDEKNTKNT